MKKLIVNADDFGLSELTNKGIVDCFRHGIVTSTTIMANGKAFEHAVKLAKQYKLDVGIHLNIVEGRSLSKAKSLVDDKGMLTLKNIMDAMFRRINLNDVEKEFKAQMEAALKSGIKLTHIDGHKHAHIFPGIIDIVIKLAREYKVKKVRLPIGKRLELGCLFSVQGWKKILIQRFARKAKKKFKKAGIISTGMFHGIRKTGKLTIVNLKKTFKNIKDSAELMAHPGYYDDNVNDNLKYTREKELRVLTDLKTKDMVKKAGIKLIGYREL